MNNLAYRTYNIESIKNEFLNIGFSEEAIDFVFLHNDNYSFEYLKEKIIDVEKTLRKDISNLDTKIDNVEKNLNYKIDSLNTKIDSVNTKIDFVEKNLQKDLFILNAKIDNEVKNLRKDLNMGNRLIHFMILTAAILGPILNALFMKYLQFIK
ncbi:KID repeat-containing protein [Borreliella japonica]|uniref:KID repeat-containing protein n=1 Tax=Borreliella japonica TaxID=34095 RepID=A0A1G4QF69_BORJA|nr:Bdr family repetitive protein [Borreliella japonica]SCW42998.1 KID repeat-containing protein [Borreliella japonica]